MIASLTSIINKSAEKVLHSFFWRQLFFILATGLTLGLMGYYFGTFDQVSHIPFLKKLADPSLYPNDRFFDLQKTHYSYFWLFFIPFFKVGILEPIMFVIYLFTVYFTFWNIYYLSFTLFNNKTAAFLSVIVFIFPHVGFAGFPVFEFSLINRTFVLPFLLLAINLYLQKRYYLSFFLLGLLYNLHVISVNFVIFMLIVDSLKQRFIKNKATVILNCILFIIAALPVFLWKFGQSPIDLTVKPEWFSLISRGAFKHLFYYFEITPPTFLLTINGVATIVFYFLSQKEFKSKYQQILNNFMVGAIIVLFAQLLATYFYPAVIIIQSQIVRIGIFVLIIGYLQFIAYFNWLYYEKKISAIALITLLSVIFFSPLFILTLVTWLLMRKFPTVTVIKVVLVLLFLSDFTIILVLSKLGIWRPQIHVYPEKNDNYRVQQWVKNNTDKSAFFIVPPSLWWFYDLDWRVISERSTVVTWSELLEAAFTPEYIPYWYSRFNDLAPGTLEKFNGDVINNFKVMENAYYSLDQSDFYRLSQKYQAQFLLVEKPHYYNFPIVYQNNSFILYQLRH